MQNMDDIIIMAFNLEHANDLWYSWNTGDFKIKSRESDGKLHFVGFKYFSPHSIMEANDKTIFIAAVNKNNFDTVYGVIEISLYPTYAGDGSMYLGLSYVDVHSSYRHKKIATSMIVVLNKLLLNYTMYDTLYVSRFTECGIENNLKSIMLTYISSKKLVFEN